MSTILRGVAKAAGQVRVAGTCAAGHATRTVSAPGRNTWEGTCAHEGCELQVRARRIPAERIPDPASTADAATPAEPDPYELVEVTYDAPTPARKRQPAARTDADGQPVQQPPAGSPVAPLPAAGPDDPGADPDPGTGGGGRRWPGRRRRDAGTGGAVEFRTPFDD